METRVCGCEGRDGGYTKKKNNLYLTIQLAEIFLRVIVCLPCFEILQLFETGEYIHVNNKTSPTVYQNMNVHTLHDSVCLWCKEHILYICTHVQFQSPNTGEGGSNVPRALPSSCCLQCSTKLESEVREIVTSPGPCLALVAYSTATRLEWSNISYINKCRSFLETTGRSFFVSFLGHSQVSWKTLGVAWEWD